MRLDVVFLCAPCFLAVKGGSTSTSIYPFAGVLSSSKVEARVLRDVANGTAVSDAEDEDSGQPIGHLTLEAGAPDMAIERVIAAMTLGFVAFQACLFYVVNYRDHDMKRYSLSVIGSTISIFCAVLTFAAIFHAVKHQWELRTGLTCGIYAYPAFAVFLFLFMELIVMFVCRVRGEKAMDPVIVHQSKRHQHYLAVRRFELNAKIAGAFVAQMCAAAAMRGFGHYQMLAYEDDRGSLLVWAVVPGVGVFLFMIAWLVAQLRQCIIVSDNIVDQAELIWIRISEECENEVICLCCGFHLAVAVRVLITDSLPYVILEMAEEHRAALEVARTREILCLWAVGIVFAAVCILINIVCFGQLRDGISQSKLRSDSLPRIVRLLTQSIGMGFAWCMCFGTHLFAVHLITTREGIQLRLIVALLQSFTTFAVIVVLDFIVDMHCTGPAFDKGLTMIIYALGTSVGLSWEHAFEQCAEIAVDFMAQDQDSLLFRASDDPQVWALCLCAVIVTMVLPAFRLYIAPRMYLLIEEHEEDLHELETEYRRSSVLSQTESAGLPNQQVQMGNMYTWQGDTQLEMG